MNFINAIKIIRPKQWLKNILIFIPNIASESLSFENFTILCIVFISFSLIVSSTYVLNDILDIESDREHPTKKNRPLASGNMSIGSAKVLSAILFLMGSFIALRYDLAVFVIIYIYAGVTIAYSIKLKYIKFMDLLSIGFLFVIRLIIGGTTTNTYISSPLILFVLFSSVCVVAGKKFSILSNNEILKSRVKSFLNSSYRENELKLILQSSAVSSMITYIIWLFFIKIINIINFSSILLIFSAVSLSFFFYFFINKTLNGETEEIVEIMFIDRAISISLFSFSIFFILGIT
jgi:decaprenyl-phosphate phosphoribosyltransferase